MCLTLTISQIFQWISTVNLAHLSSLWMSMHISTYAMWGAINCSAVYTTGPLNQSCFLHLPQLLNVLLSINESENLCIWFEFRIWLHLMCKYQLGRIILLLIDIYQKVANVYTKKTFIGNFVKTSPNSRFNPKFVCFLFSLFINH